MGIARKGHRGTSGVRVALGLQAAPRFLISVGVSLVLVSKGRQS